MPFQTGTYFEPAQQIVEDPKLFQSVIGSLLFASRVCRPEVAYIINRLSVFSQEPGVEHIRAAKRILNSNLGIFFKKNVMENKISLFTDASWKNVPGTLASIDGHIIFWNEAPILWQTKKQTIISQSSTEAETVVLARGISNLKWFTNILDFFEVENKLFEIFNDNQGTIKLILGQVVSGRSRYIDLKYFYSRYEIEKRNWKLTYIMGLENPADILTKPSNKNMFYKQRNKLLKERIEEEN
eukprot:snap_masked-scaffold_2-processed-gene-1.46-mRNA-1 protein AED:1.00 eAED:1.00 QI:0/0/0/0/1/1/2/0/240